MCTMRKEHFLQKLYEINDETGNYIIEVAVSKYTNIFNAWDNSPFKKRDLYPELELFLHSCSNDIPYKYNIDICFHMPSNSNNTEKEQWIVSSLKTYYSFYYNLKKRVLNETYYSFILYIVISFIILFASFFMEEKLKGGILFNTVLEGLRIGGWVLLWESISFFLFKRAKMRDEVMEYRRFMSAGIYFKYDIKQNE